MSQQNYVDIYEQLIDEDPGSKDYFEMPEQDDDAVYFDKIEDKALEDLAKDSKRAPMTQSGGIIRTQLKRPLSRKLINSF